MFIPTKSKGTILGKPSILISLLIIFLFPSLSYANTINSQLLKASDTRENGEYVRKRFLSIMKVPFDKSDSRKKALIIGDSHAQNFLNSATESGHMKQYQIRTRYIPMRCQIFLGDNPSSFIAAKDKALCSKSDNLTNAREQISEADLIILAANWQEWSAKHLAQTIQNMKLGPQQKVVVLGKKSYGKIAIRKYIKMSDNDLRTLRNNVDGGQTKINTILKSSLDSTVFIDQQKLVCGTHDNCPVFTENLDLISFDGGHLTQAGAAYVGDILFKKSLLAEL